MMDGQDEKENVRWKGLAVEHLTVFHPKLIDSSTKYRFFDTIKTRALYTRYNMWLSVAARSNDSGVARTFLWHRRGQNSPESRYHQLASAQPDLIIPNCFITGNCVWNEQQSVSPRDDLHWGSPMTQAEVKN